jgi:cytochrome c oxidase subunit II
MKPSQLLVAAVCLLAVVLVAGAVASAIAGETGQVIKLTAKRYEYSPSEITLKKGMPVTLELTSLDRLHGFNCPDLGIRTDIMPGKVNRLHFVPQKAGTFEFHCDIFCGEGHETMTGKFIVTE